MATKKRKRRRSRLLPAVLAVLGLALGFGAGYTVGAANQSGSSEPVTILKKQTVSARHSFFVSFEADGEVIESREISAGSLIPACTATPEGRTILRWLDGNGNAVEPATLRAYTDLRFTAVTGPALSAKTGYFPGTTDYFLPEAALNRLDFARILYGLLAERPDKAELLRDTDSKEAAGLVALGLMEAPNGVFSPEEELGEESFRKLLLPFFPTGEIDEAMSAIEGYGGESVTRAEAAVVLNVLLGLEGERECYLPDIESGYWAEKAVKLAAEGGEKKLPAGFINLDGYLYSIDENGYALKNAFIGSLRFDGNGRYTSGSYELDDYVAAALVKNTDASMEREEMLRAMYDYTRDHYTYLRRNYYQTGDIGWCLKEALTMYATEMGNCYCYASAFWAAARQLGYDALCVSGTIGSEHSPHGWVTISMDGGHYIFDVEIEMAYHRDGMDYVDNFKMEHSAAVTKWLYVEQYKCDQLLSMEKQYGFVQQ